MKFTKSVHFLILATFFIGSIAQTHANVSGEYEQAAQEQALRSFLDACFKRSLDQINTIDIILEQLQLIVGNNGIKVANKQSMLESIKQIRLLVRQINSNAHAYTHPIELQLLNAIIQSTVAHLEQSLRAGFTDLKPLDLEAILTRAGRLEQTAEQLQNQIKANNQSLIRLEKLASNAGLTWYNKAYRTFDSYVIQPGQKRNWLAPAFPWIGVKTELALSATALATYMLWKFSHIDQNIVQLEQSIQSGTTVDAVRNIATPDTWSTTLTKKYLLFIRNYLKYPAFSNPANGAFDGTQNLTKPIGFLGQIEQAWGSGTPLFMWLAGRTLTPSFKYWSDFCKWMDRKTTVTVNKLKGGGFLTQPVEPGNTSIPTTTLDDLIGLDEVKEVFTEIVAYFKDPETFDRSKLTPERGFLLTGPPRTGKTFSAECLAGEIRAMYEQTGRNPDDFKYIELNASFIKQEGIGNIFTLAKFAGPCILFIDEIDLLGLQRVGGNSTDLSECLTGLCKCLQTNPTKPVVIIAATNRPQNIDAALTQRGRFGKELRFEFPNSQNRHDFFVKKLHQLSADSSQFNIEQLVRETENCSYEDIAALINSAFFSAKLQRQTLTQAHLDMALDKETRHILFNSNHVLPDKKAALLAANIAGKALVLELLQSDELIAKATILPYMPQLKEETTLDTLWQSKENEQKKIEYGKLFTYNRQDTQNVMTRSKEIEKIKCIRAGSLAEDLLFGDHTYNTQDSQTVQRLAEKIVTNALDLTKLPEELKAQYIKEAIQLRETCDMQVLQLLTAHRAALEALKNALLEKKILTGSEIKEIIAKAIATPAIPAQ